MHMFAKSYGIAELKTISVRGEKGELLYTAKEIKCLNEKAHRKAVAHAIRNTFDLALKPNQTSLKLVGLRVFGEAYLWIAVITRRTTRTRA